ncbi:MAG: DNA repair protein RecO [Candidatus Cyclobacteriaceae bacterium M2_1C_046]
MLHKTPAIVFKTVKYKESSLIVTLLTKKFGIRTYIVNSVRTKKPKYSSALFQPLSLLDVVVYNKENANINRIAEIKASVLFSSIPYEHVKTAQILFIAEILNKLIREEEQTEDLFDFISHSIELFDHLNTSYQNFHLQFLLKLSKYLGFAAEAYHPLIRDHIDEEKGRQLSMLLFSAFDQAPVISSGDRAQLLDDILRFYRHQTDSSLELKTLHVFKMMN